MTDLYYKMMNDFYNCHPQFAGLMETCEDAFEDEESFLEWVEWEYQCICDPDELDWIADMLNDNPKEVYKLRAKIKKLLNKYSK